MKLDLSKVGRCQLWAAGNASSPNNGESEAVTIDGRLIAFNRYGRPVADEDFDWVAKSFRESA